VIRFHLSLDVADVPAAVRFLRLLLGCEPTKVRADYAKFEPVDPPVVLSLTARPAGVTAGRLNHAGLRVGSSAELVAIQRRLEEGGVPTLREDGVECCYAKQTKFWVTDPDRTQWEVYVLEGDLPHRGAGIVPLGVVTGGTAACCGAEEPP